MVHRHRKTGQPSFKPGQGNYLPYYGPSWENNSNYMPMYGYHGPNYPFAPYPRYCPHQQYLYYNQPCYYCHGLQNPGQQPYFVDQEQRNPYFQPHSAQEYSSPSIQYPVRRKKQKTAPSLNQAEPESNDQEQYPSPPHQTKTRSKK